MFAYLPLSCEHRRFESSTIHLMEAPRSCNTLFENGQTRARRTISDDSSIHESPISRMHYFQKDIKQYIQFVPSLLGPLTEIFNPIHLNSF